MRQNCASSCKIRNNPRKGVAKTDDPHTLAFCSLNVTFPALCNYKHSPVLLILKMRSKFLNSLSEAVACSS